MKCAARRVCARGAGADTATRSVARRTIVGTKPVRRILILLLVLVLMILTVILIVVLMLVLMRVLRRLSARP